MCNNEEEAWMGKKPKLFQRHVQPQEIVWAFSPFHLMRLVEMETEVYFHINKYLHLKGTDLVLLTLAER